MSIAFSQLLTHEIPEEVTAEQLKLLKTTLARRTAALLGWSCIIATVMYSFFPYPMYVRIIVISCGLASLFLAYTLKAQHEVLGVRLLEAIGIIIGIVCTIHGASLTSLVYYLPLIMFISHAEHSTRWRTVFFCICAAAFAVSCWRYRDAVGILVTDPLLIEQVALIDVIICVCLTVTMTRVYSEFDRVVLHSAAVASNRLNDSVKESRDATNALTVRKAKLLVATNELEASLRTERRAAAQGRAAAEQLEQFAYAASHDLKEPVRTIRSFSQLAQRRLAKTAQSLEPDQRERLDEYFTHVNSSTSAMNEVLERLLLYSRLGRRAVVPQTCHLHPKVEELIGALRPANPVTWQNDVPADFTLHFDSEGLGLILAEVFSNSLQYTHPSDQTHIRISTSTTAEGNVVLTIEDNGIGVEEEYRPQVFGIFRRLHARGSYPGAGIGLALVAQTAQANGACARLVDSSLGGVGFALTIQPTQKCTKFD